MLKRFLFCRRRRKRKESRNDQEHRDCGNDKDSEGEAVESKVHKTINSLQSQSYGQIMIDMMEFEYERDSNDSTMAGKTLVDDFSLAGLRDILIEDDNTERGVEVENTKVQGMPTFGGMRYPMEIQIPSSYSPTTVMERLHREQAKEEEKSVISYEEATVAPSITFFLGSNIEQLRDEGISLAGNSSAEQKFKLNSEKCKKLNSFMKNAFTVTNDEMDETNDEMDETKTTREYSIASSKNTLDTSKISELRERKRLMERNLERRYNILPSMIEF